MPNGIIVPLVEKSSKKYVDSNNQRISVSRYGGVVTLHLYNVTYSQIAGLALDDEYKPSERVDGTIGWCDGGSVSRTVVGALDTTGSFTGIWLGTSTGGYEALTDNSGRVFGHLTYVI